MNKFLSESINDRGLFKAIFVVGMPGAGKSYTISKLSGQIAPRVVNTDRATEFLAAKTGETITPQTWFQYKDTAQRITLKSLANYVNGMLPLFIDGTSNNIPIILKRMSILHSFGYDVGLISVHAPLETALQRAEERAQKIGRTVDADFIRKVADQNKKHIAALRQRVSFFVEINNDSYNIDDSTLTAAFSKSAQFFNSPVENSFGQEVLAQLQQAHAAYMVPDIMSQSMLEQNISGWYR